MQTPSRGDDASDLAHHEAARIERALAWFEGQRGAIDDDLLDLALAPLRERLEAIAHEQRPERQLRQVTVMFCDVVGSTAMGQQLEPEDINLVMDTALARFTAIIERWRGRVLQYTGDGMLAAFGTTQTREDDAECAVLAGLGIVAEARVHSERVRREHGRPGFDVRVGLHTGPVLLGGGVDGENTIRGSTVNLAARMEQNAQPGTLRISADTWRLCAGAVIGVEQPPLTVKGRREPIRTWLVERPRPRNERRRARGVAGLRTPLIGRDDELARLKSAWTRLMARANADAHPGEDAHVNGGKGGAELITLMADAGMGKTRLESAWVEWALVQPGAALWLRAIALPQTQGQPYGLLRELLADALQLPESDTPAQARERFVATVTPLFAASGDTPMAAQGTATLSAASGTTRGTSSEAQAQAHVLGQLLGLNFADSPHVRGLLGLGSQLRTLAYHAAAEVLTRLAAHRQRPLLLRIEDLQWADSGSLHFLRHLLTLPALPALTLVATARPEFDATDPAWQGLEHERIALQPLRTDLSEALAAALLEPLADDHAAHTELQTLLVERAAGNPFYMEELVQMLLDAGSIQTEVSSEGAEAAPAGDEAHAPNAGPTLRWRFDRSHYDAGRLPPTLTGVLQARLDRLTPAARHAVQQAAVLGLAFELPVLGSLDGAAADAMETLTERGFVAPRQRAALEAGESFAFTHQLLHQVVYGSLLRPEREAAHARAAQWYATAEGLRPTDRYLSAADHFERAGLGPDSARFSLAAAQELSTRFAHDAVAEQAARGLRLASADALADRWSLLLLQQRALRHAGRHQAQGLALEAIEHMAELTREPAHAATAALRRLVALQESGQMQQALDAAPLAVAAAREAGDVAIEIAASNAWAGALRAGGQHDESDRIAAEALPRARSAGLRALESELLLGRAAVAMERGDVAAAERHTRQALVIDREMGNRVGECVGLVNLGANALQRGDFAQAHDDLEAAMLLCRAIGRRQFEVSVLLNRSALELARGDAQAAAAAAQQAQALADKLGHREFGAFAALSRGAAALALGQPGEAATAYAAGHDSLEALGLPHLAIEAVAGLARAALDAGDTSTARAQADRVHAHWLQHGQFDGTERPVEIAFSCFDAWGAADDPRGLAMLRDAWRTLTASAARLPQGRARERWMNAHATHRRLQALAEHQGWSIDNQAVETDHATGAAR